ncbi:N-acetyltransferase [Ottowia sp. GY511]|uniref:GNAT family N-acetyltransferase n=1 Tax=Ottowia flava TaxID=2675430 RepID=A0ABW4KX85_9BURK|nr:GNAT family N-acetyltransferase [Ottowia sp. GY511]TXK33498.1 N-acetyltransferase [Ottowia sp. GY511]
MPLIRPSTDQDVAAVTAIYTHHVLHGTGTFETEPPTEADMAQRRQDVLARQLPWLVAEDAQRQVVGFAYCNWFKPRAAYRFSAEDSIYLHPDVQTRGLGRAMLSELERAAQAAGVRKLIAVIGDSANTGSVGLHRAMGFADVGTISACGWKFNRWLDIVLMEKAIGAGAALPADAAATAPKGQPCA